MALASTTDSAPEPEGDARALGTLLAALGPLFALAASASPFPPALGGARAIDAALALAPAEPPGYPLATLLLRACSLLPLGPIALRAAFGTALCTALAAAALFRAIDLGLRQGGGLRPLVASPLALGLTTTAFAAPPLFTPHAHAHAAAVALSCLCLERLMAFERTWPQLALGPLRGAALLWGLLLAEQPALAAVLLLAAAPSLRRLLAAYRLPAWNFAPFVLGAPLWLFGALARAPELGLPAASSPPAALRAAFALAAGPQLRPWTFVATDPAALAHSALLALAAVGAVLGLRARGSRTFAGVWLGSALAALVGALNLAHAAPCWALLPCAAAGLASFALAPLLGGEARNALAPVLAVVLVLFGATALYSAAADARARDFTAADALGDPLRRQLPARGALLLAPELAAAWIDAEREERARPDLLAALQPWQLDLAAAERVAARNPELLPLLRADLLAPAPARAVVPDARGGEGLELPRVELAALAARRPVLLELRTEAARALHDALLPYGLYHQVSTHGVSKSDIELAARDANRRLARLDAQLDLTRLPVDAARLLAERYRAELAYAEAGSDAALAARTLARLRAIDGLRR